MPASTYEQIESGPFPYDDGWGWMYRLFERLAPTGGALRRWLCGYLLPFAIERWRDGLIYRLLGVPLFGAVIPTGGRLVRRVTGARMAPYTLTSCSLGAARAFYYRTCAFEAAHLPFFLALLALTLNRAALGRADLVLENTIVNLVVNVYPILHHRRTRTRIVELLERRSAHMRG